MRRDRLGLTLKTPVRIRGVLSGQLQQSAEGQRLQPIARRRVIAIHCPPWPSLRVLVSVDESIWIKTALRERPHH